MGRIGPFYCKAFIAQAAIVPSLQFEGSAQNYSGGSGYTMAVC